MGEKFLSLREVAQYLGFSISHMYKLTMEKKIPFFKPLKGKLLFRKSEVDQWLQDKKKEEELLMEERADKMRERQELLRYDLHLSEKADEYEISERLKKEETALMRFRKRKD